MRAVVQRVTEASVLINGETYGEIGAGVVVFLGVGAGDNEKDAGYLAGKIANLRIFEDDGGKMNLSLLDMKGSMLAVSQFTLFGDCRHGRRPGFDTAAKPCEAEPLYEDFIRKCRALGLKVETGRFQAEMLVEIHNDGPVTMLLDSGKNF